MIVSELWRYPVKSMAGEKISVAQLGELGIRGDRIVHAENARRHVRRELNDILYPGALTSRQKRYAAEPAPDRTNLDVKS